jgi:hypothetical protein
MNRSNLAVVYKPIRVVQQKHEKVHHGHDGYASAHGLGGLVVLNDAVLQLSRAQGHTIRDCLISTSRNLGCFMTAVTCRTCTRSPGQPTRWRKRTWSDSETVKRTITTRTRNTEHSCQGTRSSSTTSTLHQPKISHLLENIYSD